MLVSARRRYSPAILIRCHRGVSQAAARHLPPTPQKAGEHRLSFHGYVRLPVVS